MPITRKNKDSTSTVAANKKSTMKKIAPTKIVPKKALASTTWKQTI